MKTVYLCGPMDFATQEHQTIWRKHATDIFGMQDIKTLDPCRRSHVQYLNKKEIFNLDIVDLNESDILLYDYRNNNIKQFGSPCEIMYFSYILKKPVIAWYEESCPPSNKAVFQDVLIDKQLPSLEDAIDHITCYYK